MLDYIISCTECTALRMQQLFLIFFLNLEWASMKCEEKKKLIRLITAALCKRTSLHKWSSSTVLTPACSPATHPSHPVSPSHRLCAQLLATDTPLQTPAHAYNVEEHTYKLCPAAVTASSGGCWRGEWNKRNAAGEHLCKELVLSAAPPFAMMHTSYVKLKLKRQTTGGHRPALS